MRSCEDKVNRILLASGYRPWLKNVACFSKPNVISSCCWFEEDAARNYSKVRAARAARIFVTIPPIKFLIDDVFIPVAVVYAKAPRFNMYRDTLLTLC